MSDMLKLLRNRIEQLELHEMFRSAEDVREIADYIDHLEHDALRLTAVEAELEELKAWMVKYSENSARIGAALERIRIKRKGGWPARADYEEVRAIVNELEELRRIRAQAIIDTRKHVICNSYLGERTAMMELLGMDERGNIKEGE